jgi:RimJ/RimL family protein N-acetyltransferase
MNTVFMESERLYYRAPELSDTEIFTRWINDPRIRTYLDTRVFPLSQLAEDAWIRRFGVPPSGGTANDVVVSFGRKGEDGIIGTSGLHGINWIARHAEWGILIGDPADWNRGYGREVARRMLSYAFASLNLNRVHLRVNTGNAGGIRAYEAAGFVREGSMRQASWVNGHYEDLVMMSVLRDDWMRERLPPPEPPAATKTERSKTRKSFRSR